MTEQEHILHELAHAFVRSMDKRVREGKSAMPEHPIQKREKARKKRWEEKHPRDGEGKFLPAKVERTGT